MDLTDIPIDQLVAEVSRRMHCMDKPEKRVIMVGKCVKHTLYSQLSIDQQKRKAFLTGCLSVRQPADQHVSLDWYELTRSTRQWEGHPVPQAAERTLLMPFGHWRYA